jgi:endonuclease/exonuclease/phosphatase family metal-dependent hydrolase
MPSASHARIAAITALECDGAVFTVANTHLDQRHAHNRRRSAEQLVEWVGDGPAVLVGDFNAAPDDGELEPLRAAGFRRVGLDGEAEGTSHAFSGRADLIDHCFVSAHWQTIAGRVDRVMPGGRSPSDHWPIVVDLSLNEF